jgi:hypothetical protein
MMSHVKPGANLANDREYLEQAISKSMNPKTEKV